MEKKKVKEIMKDFYEEYQEDPKGWSFWISPPPSSDEFYEAYIVHQDEAFFLKLDSIFTPNPVGIGSKLGIEENQLVENLPDFGFRKFSREETEKFLENLPKPDEYESGEEFTKKLVEARRELVDEAMKKDPVPLDSSEAPEGITAVGPYSMDSPLSYISERQEKLKRKLSKELDKMVKRDYPGYY